MGKIVGAVAVTVCLAFGLQAETEAAKTPKTVKATGLAARLEQVAYAMLPEEKMNRAMGFFGPVAKKYLPVFNQFMKEYNVAEKKLPVIAKYAPQAEKALADAKAMKVPAKYEAEKAEYIKMAEGFVMVLKMSMKLYSAGK